MKNEKKFQLDQEKIRYAATCIKELENKMKKNRKKDLLSDDSVCPLFLQITLKKIPEQQMGQRIKIHLPYSLIKENTEVCLITGDLDKRDVKAPIEPTVLYYKELLQKHGINSITEIIPLRQLRTEYKSFESKRALLGAYDVFLADNRITGNLPKLLGKFSFADRKFPIQINMNSPNLKDQFDKALNSSVLHLTGRGNSCLVEVAHLGLEVEQIIKNVVSAVNSLTEALPGSYKNIMSLYLKSAKSLAVPLYVSFGNPNDIKLKVTKKKMPGVVGELHNKKVKIFPNLNFEVLDDGTGTGSESDSETEQIRNKKLRKKQRQKYSSKKLAEDKTVEDADNREGELKICMENALKNTMQILKKRKLNAMTANKNILDALEDSLKSRKKSKTIAEIKDSNCENNDTTATGVAKSKFKKRRGKANKNKHMRDSVKMIIPKKAEGYDSSQFKVFTPAEQETKQSPIHIGSMPVSKKAKSLRNTNLNYKQNFMKAAAEINKKLERLRKTDAQLEF